MIEKLELGHRPDKGDVNERVNVGADFRVHQRQQDLIVHRLEGHGNGRRLVQLVLLHQFLQRGQHAFLRFVQYYLLPHLALPLTPLLVRALQIELFRILPAVSIGFVFSLLRAATCFARGKEGKGGRNLNNLSPPRFFPRISSKYILVNFENARNVGRTGRNVVYSRGSDKSKVSTRQIYESSSPNRFSKRRYSSRTYLTGDEGFLGKLMRK